MANNSTLDEQRRATRIYLILMTISLFIFVVNNLLVYSSTTLIVSNPSLEQYQKLQEYYNQDAISCPCSQLSIPYSAFVELTFDLHQVCTSQFVSDLYIEKLFETYNQLDFSYAKLNAYTLKGTSFTHFQALSVLCNQVKDVTSDGRREFLSSSIISAYVIDRGLFDKQINASLVNFRSTLPDVFLYSLHLLRGMIQGNGIISSYSTNWYLQMNNVTQYATVYLHPQFYGNCSCATLSTCTQPSIPFIPGYLVGCTPLESLLQSTIECLYNQSCVDLLTVSLNMSLSSSIGALNENETRFSTNETVDSIIQEMFIERWSSNSSYENFFRQCQPLACYVTTIEPNKFIIAATTILGLQGGLTTFFKLVVPWFVSTINKLSRRSIQRTQSRVHNIDLAHMQSVV